MVKNIVSLLLVMLALSGPQLLGMHPTKLYIVNGTKQELTIVGTAKSPITPIAKPDFSKQIAVKDRVEIPTPAFLTRLDIVEKRWFRKPVPHSILDPVKDQIERAFKDNLNVWMTITESKGEYGWIFTRFPKWEDEQDEQMFINDLLAEQFNSSPDLSVSAATPSVAASAAVSPVSK